MELLACWGKCDRNNGDYHPLLFHLLDSAACAEVLADTLEITLLPVSWMGLLVALHDVGKADPLFQNKDPRQVMRLETAGIILPPPEQPPRFRHEARSALFASRYLTTHHGWGRRATGVVAGAIKGHHGNFMVEGNQEEDQFPERFAAWEAQRTALTSTITDLLQPPPLTLAQFPDASAAGVMLAGLIVLADWLASNETLFEMRAWRSVAPKEYLALARETARRVVEELAFEPSASSRLPTPPAFADLWPTCTRLRPSQQTLQQLCLTAPPPPGLAILEAPMGEGKTEAALYLATVWGQMSGRTGVYLALPTAATSNQMHERYRAFLARLCPEATAPRLVHGMAWLIDDTPIAEADGWTTEDADDAREWFRPSKHALLAHDGVGTIDQALMGALNVRHGFLRLFGLSRKLLIIDEVHAYDAYMSTILDHLLAWCRALDVPVILLSATLSSMQRQRLLAAYGVDSAVTDALPAYPLLTFANATGTVSHPVPGADDNVRTVQVRTHPGLLDDATGIAKLAVEVTADGGCACVLMNTVDGAQQVFQALGALPSEERMLFHARMRAEARSEIERQVMALFGKDATARPSRMILVATQVVEQSLDVDFDVMLSQLAPIDLLLQRSGRICRHDRGPRTPWLHVLLPDHPTAPMGGSEAIYTREILLRTLGLLVDKPTFDLPRDFRPLIEGCYGVDAPPPAGIPPEIFAAAVARRQEKLAKEAQAAARYLIPLPMTRCFTLADNLSVVPVEEEEGDADEYFHASTRLGNRTRPVLLLRDPVLLAAVRQEVPPPRAVLRQLFLQKVDLPVGWLQNLCNQDGTPLDTTVPRWLRRHLVLPLSHGRWDGQQNGRPVAIVDDPVLGVYQGYTQKL